MGLLADESARLSGAGKPFSPLSRTALVAIT